MGPAAVRPVGLRIGATGAADAKLRGLVRDVAYCGRGYGYALRTARMDVTL
ncbi:MAG: hypothetical protein ACYDA6_11875 [Solirubrobacteraceae bacterium]